MRQAILELLSADFKKIKNYDDFSDLKRKISKKYDIDLLLNSEILREHKQLLNSKKIDEKTRVNLELAGKLLKKRAIRTLSGIAPVAVLTKPYPCPGNCAYCPKETDVPTSYLSNEPAVMRAIRCQYDPYKQTVLRLKALENNGHEPNKIEVIVIGGTWSYLPEKYKYWYILNCFRAINDFSKIKKSLDSDNNKIVGDNKLNVATGIINKVKAPYKQNLSLEFLKAELKKEQKKNETAKYNMVGLTLETRPDYINDEELLQMRDLGATRVEIGVQAIDDAILKLNNRGHDVAEITRATKMLRDYGFKVTYHFMPALPGSNPAKDLEMFKELFSSSNFQPDQIKFYPTVVTKGSLLYEWWKNGKYQPYTDAELENLIAECKKIVPEYVRIIRLIRDIPGESIMAGNLITNLRQVIQQKGIKCRCIRCREVRDDIIPSRGERAAKLFVSKYEAGDGVEYFINFSSADKEKIYGFCRLRINHHSPIAPAIVRELHVYGVLVKVGGDKKIQHAGFGKKLMAAAEKIARKNKCQSIAVISGIGVRNYYKKLGYKQKGTYMLKYLYE